MVKVWHSIGNKYTLIFWSGIISCPFCTSEIHPLYLATELAQAVSVAYLACSSYLLIPSGLVNSIFCPVKWVVFQNKSHRILTFKTLQHFFCIYRMTSEPLAWPRSPSMSSFLYLSTSSQKLHPPAIWTTCSHLPPSAHLKLLVTALEFSYYVPSCWSAFSPGSLTHWIVSQSPVYGLVFTLYFWSCGPATEFYSSLYSAPCREPDTNRYSRNVCWIKGWIQPRKVPRELDLHHGTGNRSWVSSKNFLEQRQCIKLRAFNYSFLQLLIHPSIISFCSRDKSSLCTQLVPHLVVMKDENLGNYSPQ